MENNFAAYLFCQALHTIYPSGANPFSPAGQRSGSGSVHRQIQSLGTIQHAWLGLDLVCGASWAMTQSGTQGWPGKEPQL